jgi:hypothetical protein
MEPRPSQHRGHSSENARASRRRIAIPRSRCRFAWARGALDATAAGGRVVRTRPRRGQGRPPHAVRAGAAMLDAEAGERRVVERRHGGPVLAIRVTRGERGLVVDRGRRLEVGGVPRVWRSGSLRRSPSSHSRRISAAIRSRGSPVSRRWVTASAGRGAGVKAVRRRGGVRPSWSFMSQRDSLGCAESMRAGNRNTRAGCAMR